MKLNDSNLFRQQALINGEWLDANNGEAIDVTNPANGDKLGSVPKMGADETRAAIDAANRALPAWRALTAKERATILRNWFNLMMEHQDDLARLMTLEQGKPLAEAKGEISYAASFIEWFAEDSVEYREIRGIAREQAHALLNAGVDGLLIETVTSIRNLQPTLAGARDAADGMPVLVSFVVDDKGDLLGDGLNIEAAVLYAEKHGANSVGVNCCSLAAANAAVPRMVASATTPVTVRPNVGDPVQTQDGPVWHENPEAFARACIEWRHAGAAMVGSCCGTTAITTAAMAEALDI